ncbi:MULTISPECIES: site-specific DNA-methyltransferase [unclassified Gemella]|uniref:site-specific DNA-methyltransferase n=1 Tax=unclassified Gemella TaxID=2624949 RepID=UPI001C050D30|nr:MULTISPECIES: site-specific DNA-methyltransferase [unclassified Gemella]MBU0278956.1 site-specific DNA-methyltransferase [Gemella sp. zg-1178]QWQ39064.1 site-specific DNA-methyltransferase [Gemella sp. zg-570]
MFLDYKNKKPFKEIDKIIELKKLELKNISKGEEKGLYIKGDNFDSMIMLLNDFENQVDLVYIDPPFNTNSNFYYSEDKVSTISSSKNDSLAYSDKMALNEYLEFIRERVILIKKLLSDRGTLYFHIDCKLGHYIKLLLDEIFGMENFVNDITRVKSNPKNFKRRAFGNEKDVIYIYSKKNQKNIFNNITIPLSEDEILKKFPKIDEKGRRYNTVPCHAPGETKNGETGGKWKGMMPPKGRHWRCSPKELDKLDNDGLIEWSKNGVPRIKKFSDEHKGKKIQDIWTNFKDPQNPIYPTEKNIDMLSMIVEQSSNESSIIMDCFCGSSSFLLAGINKNRYVIGIDKSDISKEVLIKKRSEIKNLKIIEL